MPVKMRPTGEIKARLGITPSGRVQKKFQSLCYRYMDKYVPRREGFLRELVDLSNPTEIVYISPYAHYQYEGKLYVMDNGKGAYYSPKYGFWSDKGKPKHNSGKDLIYHTGGTGDHWDKRMVSAEMGDLVKDLQAYIDRGA